MRPPIIGTEPPQGPEPMIYIAVPLAILADPEVDSKELLDTIVETMLESARVALLKRRTGPFN